MALEIAQAKPSLNSIMIVVQDQAEFQNVRKVIAKIVPRALNKVVSYFSGSTVLDTFKSVKTISCFSMVFLKLDMHDIKGKEISFRIRDQLNQFNINRVN